MDRTVVKVKTTIEEYNAAGDLVNRRTVIDIRKEAPERQRPFGFVSQKDPDHGDND
jgi:hypothetical protein